MNASEFVSKAASFAERMKTAKDFTELLAMWRSTSFPYSCVETDPFSSAYRAEVESTYQAIADTSYAVDNELTSTKLSDQEFELGFPWTSKNLSQAWPEMAKVVQVMRELELREFGGKKIVEFGSGWGNLAIPLAKAGLDVSIVDIDQGFLRRVQRKAAADGVQITAIEGDYVEAADAITERYDAVIFQASFHHCLEFDALLRSLRDRVLAPGGFVLFASEPIYEDYPLPWGVRFDGESIWAVSDKKWLELGFSEDFFSTLLLRNGFLARRVAGIPTILSEAWAADLGSDGLPFGHWRLLARHDQTWHAATVGDTGRFCRERSVLPGLRGARDTRYRLTLHNFSVAPLHARFVCGDGAQTIDVAPGEERRFVIEADCAEMVIESEVFRPSERSGSSDDRTLGLYVSRVELVGNSSALGAGGSRPVNPAS